MAICGEQMQKILQKGFAKTLISVHETAKETIARNSVHYSDKSKEFLLETTELRFSRLHRDSTFKGSEKDTDFHTLIFIRGDTLVCQC